MTKQGTGRNVPLVGLVVEGQTEFAALPAMLQRLGVKPTRPSNFSGQFQDAPVRKLVEKRLLHHVKAQIVKGPDLVIVVLDRENRPESARAFEKAVRDEITKQLDNPTRPRVEVVVCDRTFENWLIADPKGIHKSEYITRDLSAKVVCHGDGKDALALIKNAFRRRKAYNKGPHGAKLSVFVRVGSPRVHLCSKSLRRFVEFVERTKQAYSGESRP